MRASWALATVATIGLVAGLAAVGIFQDWFAGDEAAVPSDTVQDDAPASADRGITNLEELSALSPAALDAQTSDVEQRLQELEEEYPRLFWQADPIDWSEDVSTIQRELSQLEQPIEYFSNPNGEKR